MNKVSEFSKIDQALKDMKQAISPGNSVNNKEVMEVVSKEVVENKAGRPTKMTPGMQNKLIKLAGELFFIRSVAGEAGISVDTIERHLKDKGFIDFAVSYTYALNSFIAHHQRLMMKYSKDKKTKDWRAEAHILTLCDKEYSERKYLTEAVANQDAKILLLIKAEQLTLASQEGMKMLKGVKTLQHTPSKPESVPLLPFDSKEVKQSIKDSKKPRIPRKTL